ncbi:MarR family winged helix-turn-helix transcriptional regulator [Paenibacillus turpanensis]|uniref:MarR family winged helix-turn-helix transcriptional regulator n=1 Tax=Paenibacillus turpanensis TaxID=2689078 RepID=UPI0014079416|nr:MarR family transcriptional regulator [Paenibacillus turpanensis]
MGEKTIQEVERFEAAIKAVSGKLRGKMQEELASLDIGLTGPQYFMLYFIEEKGSCRVKEIAEQMEVKPSAVTVMVDRLVQAGVAEREHDEQDRRSVIVRVTPEGKRVLTAINEKRKKMLGRLIANIEQSDLEQFLQTLEFIAQQE